jgi:hypothetical protein
MFSPANRARRLVNKTLLPSGIRGPCAVLTHVAECTARDAIDRVQSCTYSKQKIFCAVP